MITIAGVVIPTPSDYQVGIMDISKAERNASGTMVIDRIATKRKLELSWKFLSKDDLSAILSLVSPVFFTVQYPDPETNNFNTGTFYCGDRNVGAQDYKDGVIRWRDIKFDLIER